MKCKVRIIINHNIFIYILIVLLFFCNHILLFRKWMPNTKSSKNSTGNQVKNGNYTILIYNPLPVQVKSKDSKKSSIRTKLTLISILTINPLKTRHLIPSLHLRVKVSILPINLPMLQLPLTPLFF